jgi:hypothetical protein
MNICTVEVSSIADTGAGAVLGWVLAGLLIVALGAVVLLAVRRARSARAGAAAVLLLAVAGLAVLGPQGVSPAQAAASDVVYSDGCSLISIDESSVQLTPVGSGLLPGDSVVAVSAIVENRFAGEVEVSGEAVLGGGPLAALLETEVFFAGSPGPVTLAAGQQVTVTVTVGLPTSVDDAAQGELVDVELVMTASEG